MALRDASTAALAANSFAMLASFVCLRPWSVRRAARSARSLAASMSVAMSAIIQRIAWRSAIGRPNCTRVRAYSTAASREACAIPTACAAMLIRPQSKVSIAIRKPSPRRPSMFPAGNLTAPPRPRLRLHRGDVAPRAGLREAERAHLAALRERLQVRPLLLLCPEPEERLAHEGDVDREGDAERRGRARDLLPRPRGGDDVAARPP